MRAFNRALLTLASAALIAGCSADNQFQDLKGFMDEVDPVAGPNRTAARILRIRLLRTARENCAVRSIRR
jgi:hypothetical protein